MPTHQTPKNAGARDVAAPGNRLREIRMRQGMTLEALAAGLARDYSTVWRWENGRGFGPKQAAEAARVLGGDAASFFSPPPRGRMVEVRSTVQAGTWRRVGEISDAGQYDVVVPNVPELAGRELYAVEVAGQSMNRIYPERSVVVLERMIHANGDLVSGKRYHVEVQRIDGAVESTLKRAERDAGGKWWLIAESDQPEFQTPVPFRGDTHEHMAVIGRVVWAITPDY